LQRTEAANCGKRIFIHSPGTGHFPTPACRLHVNTLSGCRFSCSFSMGNPRMGHAKFGQHAKSLASPKWACGLWMAFLLRYCDIFATKIMTLYDHSLRALETGTEQIRKFDFEIGSRPIRPCRQAPDGHHPSRKGGIARTIKAYLALQLNAGQSGFRPTEAKHALRALASPSCGTGGTLCPGARFHMTGPRSNCQAWRSSGSVGIPYGSLTSYG